MFTDIANIARDIFGNTKDKVFFVSAPTGTGKTMGFMKHLSSDTSKVCFLMPTNAAIVVTENYCRMNDWDISRVRVYTPTHFLNELLKNGHMGTVIVDECHIDTEEYQFIIRYLKTYTHLYSRLILLSATCPVVRIKDWFPGAVIHDTTKSNEYKISYSYLETDLVQFYNAPMNQQHILRNLFKRYIRATSCPRILVFCAGSTQCEILSECFENEFENSCSYYGKMDSDLKQRVVGLFEDVSKPFILFCTNALETSVTIRNVNFVFDFGKRFLYRDKVLRMEWCDQSSMTQRAGRTGRTCDGHVVRMMSEAFFRQLPVIQDTQHDFDAILLTMYKKKKMSIVQKIFSEEKQVYETFEQRLRELRIDRSNPLKFDFVFRYRNEMQMEDALLLYKLYNRRYSYNCTDLFFLYLSVSILISMNVNNYPLFYIPKDMRRRKHTFFLRIRRAFDRHHHQDELRTYVNIFFNSFIQGSQFTQLYNLNNKFVKDVRKRFLRYWNDSVTFCKITNVRSFLRDYLNITGDELSFLHHEEFVKVQRFLLYGSRFEIRTFPSMVGYEHSHAIHDAVPLTDMIRYSTNRLHLKIKSMNVQYNDQILEKLVLWTNVDVPSSDHKDGILRYVQYMNEKVLWKAEFDDTVKEIENEVAYRPGKCRMLETMTDFYSKAGNLFPSGSMT